jgi:hypothetical protein
MVVAVVMVRVLDVVMIIFVVVEMCDNVGCKDGDVGCGRCGGCLVEVAMFLVRSFLWLWRWW